MNDLRMLVPLSGNTFPNREQNQRGLRSVGILLQIVAVPGQIRERAL